jgi:hypothetical protein
MRAISFCTLFGAGRIPWVHDQEEHAMPEGMIGAVWAFCWGVAAAAGALVGAILGLITHLISVPHH